MSTLKPVGIYREMYRAVRQDLPSLHESRTAEGVEDRERVIEYMKAGTPVFDVMGSAPDLLGGSNGIGSGQSLVSDGEWIWRVDSIHYLAHHPLAIPESFLVHVRARNYVPDSDVNVADAKFDAAIQTYF
ncbi:hypothetical protein [Nocardia sp. NPDC050406]|uniref:hypothetical protein n=1 Tax=Nocardia sp. NPDC050406 TaxID=3364318 RepID=UPI0037990050